MLCGEDGSEIKEPLFSCLEGVIPMFPQPIVPTGLGKKRLPFLSNWLGLGVMVKLVRVRG